MISKTKPMKKSTLNTIGSITMFLAFSTFIVILVVKMLSESKPEQETSENLQPIVYEFPDPIEYKYPCCGKGTLRFCPKHKQKGEEVKKVSE